MISEHNEIEAKLAAESVPVSDFRDFLFDNISIEDYKHIKGPDTYYESGPNVVRHRKDHQNNSHELTVKRRTSSGSTRDRLEVDLYMSKNTTADVEAFLKATGFVEVFTIMKEAHIFGVNLSSQLQATFVIYDVWRDDQGPGTAKRFIEIEASKGSTCTPETGKRHVRQWVKKLQEQFELGEPLNDSLYELYSGRKYQSV